MSVGASESSNYTQRQGLRVHNRLVEFLEREALPGTNIEPDRFWSGFATP